MFLECFRVWEGNTEIFQQHQIPVRKDGFKLEGGGEWFKGVFANFSKLEWTYFRNQMIKQFS